MRRLATTAGAAALSLTSIPAASAHPAFTPTFAPLGSATGLVLVIPNERRVAMNALELASPPGIAVVAASANAGWQGAVAGRRALWTGGALPPGAAGRFDVRVRPASAPGTVTFRVTQRFVDGRKVTWPLSLTVTPGIAASGDGRTLEVATGAVGALVLLAGGAVLVLLLRRRGTLSEK